MGSLQEKGVTDRSRTLNATFEEAKKAVDAGASLVHTYNGHAWF